MRKSCQIHVLGTMRGTTTARFGTLILTNAERRTADVVVARLNASGTWLWATRAGGTGNDIGTSIAIDSTGSIYVAGSIANGVAGTPTGSDFGSTTITSNGLADAFVAELDIFDNWQWATQAGGSRDDTATGIAAGGAGTVYLAGLSDSPTVVLGALSLPLVPGGVGRPAFLARLTQQPLTAIARQPLTFFMLCPNPSQGTAMVSGLPAHQLVQTLDILGRVVVTGWTSEGGTLPLTLPTGVYVVRSGAHSRRLIVN